MTIEYGVYFPDRRLTSPVSSETEARVVIRQNTKHCDDPNAPELRMRDAGGEWVPECTNCEQPCVLDENGFYDLCYLHMHPLCPDCAAKCEH